MTYAFNVPWVCLVHHPRAMESLHLLNLPSSHDIIYVHRYSYVYMYNIIYIVFIYIHIHAKHCKNNNIYIYTYIYITWNNTTCQYVRIDKQPLNWNQLISKRLPPPSDNGDHVVDALGRFAHLTELSQFHLHRCPARAARLCCAACLGAGGRHLRWDGWYLSRAHAGLISKNGI